MQNNDARVASFSRRRACSCLRRRLKPTLLKGEKNASASEPSITEPGRVFAWAQAGLPVLLEDGVEGRVGGGVGFAFATRFALRERSALI
jgi:hypothetical protein